MLANLATLDRPWELIIVNDGSTDNSFALAHALEPENPQLRVIGYAENRGRGFALRTGIIAARGEIVVTTEVDCSWGDDIVHRIVKVFDEHPNTDMVVASPNLPGGGYQNVPPRRVAISRGGNMLLRAALSTRITMYTGHDARVPARALSRIADRRGREGVSSRRRAQGARASASPFARSRRC